MTLVKKNSKFFQILDFLRDFKKICENYIFRKLILFLILTFLLGKVTELEYLTVTNVKVQTFIDQYTQDNKGPNSRRRILPNLKDKIKK